MIYVTFVGCKVARRNALHVWTEVSNLQINNEFWKYWYIISMLDSKTKT